MEGGGFFRPSLPSPPPSVGEGDVQNHQLLPRPRALPLRPGSQKQSALIDYVDSKLLHISRKYQKRHSELSRDEQDLDEDVQGYASFDAMARDLVALLDVVWMSGTPSLQNPYLLTIALTVSTSLSSFSFCPSNTFRLLRKLDTAFASLLQGSNIETNQSLPGFESGYGPPSMTEKVRLRGIVERTRVLIVEVAGKSGSVTEASFTDDFAMTEEDDDVNEIGLDDSHDTWEMEIARVYQHTLTRLNMSLQSTEAT